MPEEIKQIYHLVESELNPLELCKRLAPLLAALEGLDKPLSGASPVPAAGLADYVKPLQQIGVLRMLRQLSNVYSVMKVRPWLSCFVAA